MSAALLYPFIIVAGALQALGNSMNAQLRGHLVNPFLAAAVSFLPIVFVFATLFLVMTTPLPSLDSLAAMPWYAPLGGVAGAVAVFGGLAFVDKVGAGPFNGLTLTANILTSLAMDSLGLFGLQGGGFKPMPWLGGLLMAIGVTFIARVTPDKGAGQGAGQDETENTGHGLNPRLLYPFIVVAGALQAIGVVWNAQLRGALINPWLAALVSFLPVVFVFVLVFLLRPKPLPQRADIEGVRWWMPLAGLTGAVAVFAGLLFVDKVGAGAFNGLLITANLLTSVALDHFGWVGMKRVRAGASRLGGAALMVAGIVLISLF
ncbi:UNVERIFIED_ORG: transporter family-2 protein [Methylobacterium sp. SuP10 SLI 274]|uniref:DMT family transporter n=1 Tax=Methylorubrum extorquens TaxID=408 RepID=UPI00209D9407|nr:DMT family transporter [Methylorubrum extorquens]MDF9863654.1 transporter family-2 protein [Methylorubrum pseudosasae]MDH6637255.1 transporter family-2 protein [Methylobacterium sp. SuP10 SLI 274]MDH6666435.1 transporter family-2 protein [Methylorubrum zatmanii]MCP1558347.1 transporter family-2 protein [Methylorubrum extorquens]MDF9791966.1 transporter family-2 protein [Methylorubrum extorquens]